METSNFRNVTWKFVCWNNFVPLSIKNLVICWDTNNRHIFKILGNENLYRSQCSKRTWLTDKRWKEKSWKSFRLKNCGGWKRVGGARIVRLDTTHNFRILWKKLPPLQCLESMDESSWWLVTSISFNNLYLDSSCSNTYWKR